MTDEAAENNTAPAGGGESGRLPVERRGGGERRGGTDRRGGVERRSGLDRRRGPGRRRGEVRRAAEEGEISGDLLEFVMAVDEYKRINERPYPTISEVFEIIHYLGYRKVAERAAHINIKIKDTEYKEDEES